MSVADAEKLMKDALKHENNKTFMIKASPEWDLAAQCYQQAAQIFRSPPVKAFPRAVDAFEKAAHAHLKNKSPYNAGVCYDNAGNTLRDNGGMDQCGALYKQASQYYHESDNIEKAAESCIKAAKATTDTDPDGSIKLFIEAIELYEGADKHIFIADTWRSCLSLMLKNQKMDSAIQLLEKMQRIFVKLEQTEYLRKAQLSVIILKLSKGDPVAASAAREDYEESEFSFTKEGDAASHLIEAFEEGDVDRVSELVKTQIFTLLENQVARAAAKLPAVCKDVAGDMTGASQAAPASAAAAAAGGDDDDDLC
mmetsp:Transcript_32884/g.82966  ORF Transcript_32884/g.82966 Transcript_32884/m.82966 type:complete len:310 (-) Transcript_32884:158-1087(-)|eukprot:CAMPEP_0173419714 /NCGR_PEP_ID=MMETSP1357-20121228/1447_1 /TAXON_ID=77926 /ORGANISM="Hemiselmis rufescens, Strain PCC563" /LENGTH=309 /DNA_ID=CAMNT_0014382391 /DNA_START=114 /DNA_END=1043 /DNA_ORIENTATION=+